MPLSSLLLSLLAGILMGLALDIAGLTNPNWMGTRPTLAVKTTLLSLILFAFIFQMATGNQFLAGPYLSYFHVLGGLIFGIGLYAVKSCPLSMFKTAAQFRKNFQALLLLASLFVIGIKLSNYFSSLFAHLFQISGFTLYLYDILRIDPVKMNFVLVLILGIYFFKLFWEPDFNKKHVALGFLAAVSLVMAQAENFEMGTVYGFQILTSFESIQGIQKDFIFFIALTVTLFILSIKNIAHGEASGRPGPNSFLGFFLLGFGGQLAGGCTLSHGIEGLSALSVGSIIFLLVAGLTPLLITKLKMLVSI